MQSWQILSFFTRLLVGVLLVFSTGCSFDLSIISDAIASKIIKGGEESYIRIDNIENFPLEGKCPEKESQIVLTEPVNQVLKCVGGKFSAEIAVPKGIPDGLVNFELTTSEGRIKWSVQKDTVPPAVTLASSASSPTNMVIPVTVNFSESVTGFTQEDIVVTNGAISGLAGSGANYKFDVTPAAQGEVTVAIAADVALDIAGNKNTASDIFKINYDSIPPTITGLSNDSTPKKSKVWSWGCNESCTYRFVIDQSPVNLSLGAFGNVVSDSQIHGDGLYYLHIQAQDTAGNTSAVQHFSALLDNTGPAITISEPSRKKGDSSTEFKWEVTYSDGAISLSTNDIVPSGSASQNCQISIASAGALKRVVQFTGCTGTGDIAFSIKAGSAKDVVLNESLTAGPSAAVSVDENYVKPGISLSAPSPDVGTRASVFEWTVTYTLADTILLQPSDVNLGGAVADCAVSIHPDTSLTRKIRLSGCSGDGSLYLGLKAGTASNSFDVTDEVPFKYASGDYIRLYNTPVVSLSGLFAGNYKPYSWKNTDTPVITWFPHPENGGAIARYEVAIGRAAGTMDIMNWTDVGLDTKFSKKDLGLLYAETLNGVVRSYNICVRGIDVYNKSSTASCSEWKPTWGGQKSVAYPVDGDITDSVVDSSGRRIIIGGFQNIATNEIAVMDHIALNVDGGINVSNSFLSRADHDVLEQSFFSDGKLLLRGNFSYYDEILTRGLAKVNLNGSIDSSFSVGNQFRRIDLAVPLSGGGVLVAGEIFSNANNINDRKGVWRLNASGNIDAVFSRPLLELGNNSVSPRQIAVQSDGKILVLGDFTKCNGIEKKYLCRFNSDGSIDGTFADLDIDNRINSFAVQSDGKIVILGGFDKIEGISKKGIARLTSGGQLDSSFQSGTGLGSGYFGTILLLDDDSLILQNISTPYNGNNFPAGAAIKIDKDGNVLPGTIVNHRPMMPFSSQNGKVVTLPYYTSQYQVVRYNLDGSLDATFQLDKKIQGEITSIRVWPDGSIHLWGSLKAVLDTVEKKNIARFDLDGKLDATFNPDPSSLFYSPNNVFINSQGHLLLNAYNHFELLDKNDGHRISSFTVSCPPGIPCTQYPVQVAVDSLDRIYGMFRPSYDSNYYIVRLDSAGVYDGAFAYHHLQATSTPSMALGKNADGYLVVLGDDGTDPVFGVLDSTGQIINNSLSSFLSGKQDVQISGLKLDKDDNIYISASYQVERQSGDGSSYQTRDARIEKSDRSGIYWGDVVTFAGRQEYEAAAWIYAIQDNGKIISGVSLANKTSVLRYHANGTLDSSFRIADDYATPNGAYVSSIDDNKVFWFGKSIYFPSRDHLTSPMTVLEP